MKRLIFIAIVLLLFAGSAFAATETFYVCQGGNGTLPETATCATAYDISDFNTSGNWAAIKSDDGKIGPDDDVVFMDDGGIHYTPNQFVQPQQSGLSGEPITITVQSGDSVEIRQTTQIASWTDNSGSTPNTWYASYTAHDPNIMWEGSTPLMDKKGSEGALVDYGDFYHDDGGDLIYMYKTTDPGADVEVASNDTGLVWIDNVDYITITKGSGTSLLFTRANEYGIRWTSAENLIIDGVSVSYAYYNGLVNNWNSGAISSNITIQNNEVSYCGGDGIAIAEETGGTNLISGNTVHHNSQEDDDAGQQTTAGIKVYNNATGGGYTITIEDNEVYNEGTGGATASNERGNGIWVDTWGDNTSDDYVIVRYNKAYDNMGSGIVVEKGGYNKVYYNLVWDNGFGAAQMDATYWGSGILIFRDTSNNTVYNNVSYSNVKGIAVTGVGIETNLDNNLVKNNIAIDNSEHELYADMGGDNNDDGSGNVYTYNAFGVEATDFILFDDDEADDPDTYDEWETLYGSGTNSVESDPNMANPGNDDFTITSSSPCYEAGTDVGLTQDFIGTSVPQDTYPEIGAYEVLESSGEDPSDVSTFPLILH